MKIELVGPALDRAVAAVFFPLNATLADVAPPHWQLCARGEVTKNRKDGIVCTLDRQEQTGKAAPDAKSEPFAITVFVDQGQDRIPRYAALRRMVYGVSRKTMVPPKPIHTPDPHYTETRINLVNATVVFSAVVSESGRLEDIQISRPAGRGFDDAAAQALREWRFEPALLEGKPVSVQIAVEMNWPASR